MTKEKKPAPESLEENKEEKNSALAEAQAQIKELTELLQRTQANLENYRKQQEKRIEEIKLLANKDLLFQLLPVLDALELSLKNTCHPQEFIKSIELLYSQLFHLLADQGLHPFETQNQPFNPSLHEALLKVNSDQPENTIVEEFQKGFLFHNFILRPAKVKVSSGKPELNAEPIDKNKTDQNRIDQKSADAVKNHPSQTGGIPSVLNKIHPRQTNWR